MTDVLVGLLIGFICGYGVRELIARRRRAEYPRRHPERFRSYTEEDA
jgi:membrane-associated phospholipid phosphatase